MENTVHEVSRRTRPERACGIAPPAFSLPDTTHVGGVRLQVSDLPRSVAYDERVIGLRVLAAGETTTLGPSPLPDEAQLLGWELRVPSEDDIAAAARSLQSAGYTSERVVDGVTATDPWGNAFIFVPNSRKRMT